MNNLQLGKNGTPINLVTVEAYEDWFKEQTEFTCNWLVHSGFKAPGTRLIPNSNGVPEFVLAVVKDSSSIWNLSDLAVNLPPGSYSFDGTGEQQESMALGWALAQYRFTAYLKETKDFPILFVDDEQAYKAAVNQTNAVNLTRDLINTPAADMMPEHLSRAMQKLASEHRAGFKEIVGEALLQENYPTIHMVGRASKHAPRLLELNWGSDEHPKLTLVGKGICFDSGGLDLKPANAMRLMKKDMGGAAHVLGLAKLVMAYKLPVQLRVLVAAAENAIGNNAFRPGDVVTTRKGLTVEIDNTDAEGRLVLCDALAEADSHSPDLIIDFATLTGAARVALGLEVPGFYSTDDEFAEHLSAGSEQADDAIWQLPLHEGYADYLKGSISDLANAASSPFGGSITAALFLKCFVENSNWVHFDVGAWNDRSRPGRPKGGEAMGIRAVFAALKQRYNN